MNVSRVNEWEKDGKTRWYVDFDDGSKAVCFSESAKSLEIGKPLPEGWNVEPPKQEGWTPMLKAPRKSGGGGFGGGAAAFRNTKEGQFYEQERMDRRTAAMQATFEGNFNAVSANTIYAWLRATAGEQEPPGKTGQTAAVSSSGEKTADTRKDSGAAAAQEWGAKGTGEGAQAPCSHTDTSPLRPDGGALPNGFVRCLACGKVEKEVAHV